MRVLLQRVTRASVSVDDRVVGAIGRGLLALVGVGHASTADDAEWLGRRTAELRVFAGPDGRMARSLRDIDGGVLAVSQFTLYGVADRGRRPSFTRAAGPGRARSLYEAYCAAIPARVERGVFGADMSISLEADGPVTLLLDRAGASDQRRG